MSESWQPGAEVRARMRSEALQTPRLHAAPLFWRLFWSLPAPVALALLLDWLASTTPWITLAVALVCIPLASLVVGKAALRDFERVVAIVAPVVAPAEGQEADASGETPEAAASTGAG